MFMYCGSCLIVCPADLVQEVRHILEVSQEAFDPKYLALPVPKGHMHKGKI
jgi:Fe-S-cluster-containing hydrogenase component 2